MIPVIDAEWLSKQLRAEFLMNTRNIGDASVPWGGQNPEVDCWQFVIKTEDGREFDVVVRERD